MYRTLSSASGLGADTVSRLLPRKNDSFPEEGRLAVKNETIEFYGLHFFLFKMAFRCCLYSRTLMARTALGP